MKRIDARRYKLTPAKPKRSFIGVKIKRGRRRNSRLDRRGMK